MHEPTTLVPRKGRRLFRTPQQWAVFQRVASALAFGVVGFALAWLVDAALFRVQTASAAGRSAPTQTARPQAVSARPAPAPTAKPAAKTRPAQR